MKKEDLRSVMIGTTHAKFHHWVLKETDDNENSQISYALVEYDNGKMKEISHNYIKFI